VAKGERCKLRGEVTQKGIGSGHVAEFLRQLYKSKVVISIHGECKGVKKIYNRPVITSSAQNKHMKGEYFAVPSLCLCHDKTGEGGEGARVRGSLRKYSFGVGKTGRGVTRGGQV